MALEEIGRKIGGTLSFIWDASENLREVSEEISRTHGLVKRIFDVYKPISIKYVAKENIGILYYSETIFMGQARKFARAIGYFKGDKISFYGYMEYWFYLAEAVILYPDSLEPVDRVASEAKDSIISYAEKHLRDYIGKGIPYVRETFFEGIVDKKVRSIIEKYAGESIGVPIDACVVYNSYDSTCAYESLFNVVDGKVSVYVAGADELNASLSLADWFVKQLIRVYE